jgi:hypothetical protein
MKNGVFWYVMPCGSYKNRSFGELSASFIRVTRIGELGTTLAVTSNRRKLRRNKKCSLIPVNLMKEALSSSETSVLTRATRRNIPEDIILHSHRCENLKSYLPISVHNGARSSVMVKALGYKPKGRGFETSNKTGIYSASNRNEYQRQE